MAEKEPRPEITLPAGIAKRVSGGYITKEGKFIKSATQSAEAYEKKAGK